MKKHHEIRLDGGGNEDDIVLQCDEIHLERMTEDVWSLLVYKRNKRISLDMVIEKKMIMVHTKENELNAKIKNYPEK